MQQTLGHLVQQNHYRLNGLLKHPLLSHPYTLIEWRMQKLDDCRPDLEQGMTAISAIKKATIRGKVLRQAFSLKPTNQISHFKQRFNACQRSLQQQLYQRLGHHRQKLAQKMQQLDHVWQAREAQRRHLFNQERVKKELQQLLNDRLTFNRQKLTYVVDLLKVLDPKNVLQKGYSILFAEKSPFVINSITKLKKGQQARLLLSDGEVIITINEVKQVNTNLAQEQEAIPLSFEAAFARLEEILERLNAGTITLDDSLKLYEEADQLIAICSKRLNDAERKIEILVKNRNGGIDFWK